jgi:hypothetical protein
MAQWTGSCRLRVSRGVDPQHPNLDLRAERVGDGHCVPVGDVGHRPCQACRHGRSEDVVQRAFEKILRGYRADRPEISNIDAYVFTAVSMCDLLPRQKRDQPRAALGINGFTRHHHCGLPRLNGKLRSILKWVVYSTSRSKLAVPLN